MIKITESFIEKAQNYYKIYNRINSSKDYQNIELWQQIQDIEEAMFEPFFVMPTCKPFSDIMTDFAYKKKCTNKLINELFDRLVKESESYFLAPQKTNKEILENGIQNNESAMDILAYMTCNPNRYSIFLINKLLRQNKYSINEILNALKINIPIALSKELVKINTPEKRKIVIAKMYKLSFPFLIEFEKYIIEQDLKLIDFETDYSIQNEKDFIIIHTFEITKLEYYKNLENNFEDEVIMYFSNYSINKKIQKHQVSLCPQQLIEYLKNCINLTYFDLICPMVHIFFTERNQQAYYKINIEATYNESIIIKDVLVLKK